MKFAIAPEHRRYFEKHGNITFEELLSEQQLETLQKFGPVLVRDLWRKNEKVRSIVTSRKFVEIIYQLCNFKPIHLAFDQLLVPADESFFIEPHSLDEFSPLQGLKAGLLLCIKPEETEGNLPSKPGSGVVVRGDYPIPFSEMITGKYLLIVYTEENAVIVRNPKGLHPSSFIDAGYNIGDRIDSTLNPVLFKRI